jgi:hypothetical protein
MSTGMMERINRLAASTPIREGDTVVVYTKGEPETKAVASPRVASELSAIIAPRPDALPPLAPAAGNVAPNGARSVE